MDLAMDPRYDIQNTRNNNNKKDKLKLIKIKNVYAPKDTVKRVKREPENGRKYLHIISLLR